MGNRHELVDVGNAYIEVFSSGQAVDGDRELMVAEGKVALVLGDSAQTALVVQGDREQLRAWLNTAQLMLDRRTSGGVELTEEVLDGLAAEAERGFDVEKLLGGAGGSVMVPVRFAVDAMAKLEERRAAQGLNRSAMLRHVASLYVTPLVVALEAGRLDWPAQDGAAASREEKVRLGSTTRCRVGSALVEKLDRVELHARNLGLRHVTRSLLMRRAVDVHFGFIPEV